jgi:hypothetical protein
VGDDRRPRLAALEHHAHRDVLRHERECRAQDLVGLRVELFLADGRQPRYDAEVRARVGHDADQGDRRVVAPRCRDRGAQRQPAALGAVDGDQQAMQMQLFQAVRRHRVRHGSLR